MISAVMVAIAQKGKRRGQPKPNKVPLHLRMDLNDADIFGEPAPSMLYHYTNAAGLTGIVQSKCRLQATDHQLLNDSDEFKFGRAIAMEVLESLDAVESNVKEKATAELADLLREPSFVACLSTSHEILPQWRLYANETAGYCLGFNDLKSGLRLEGSTEPRSARSGRSSTPPTSPLENRRRWVFPTRQRQCPSGIGRVRAAAPDQRTCTQRRTAIRGPQRREETMALVDRSNDLPCRTTPQIHLRGYLHLCADRIRH